jgi:hypothetical protein
MSVSKHDTWSDRVEEALAEYAPELIRSIAARLLKTRSQWPAEELAERIRAACTNAPLIDRRLKDLPPASRTLLAAIGRSRRPTWKLPHLLSILASLGHCDGVEPIATLFDEGLVFPVRPAKSARLASWQQWLMRESHLLCLFVHPFVAERAAQHAVELPELKGATPSRKEVREADGLEFPLRLAVAWQQISGAPLRRTQQDDYFKRDFQRLTGDGLLNAPFAENEQGLPDLGLLAARWALRTGLLTERDSEVHAADFSDCWSQALYPTLVELWQALLEIEAWDPVGGWQPGREFPNPFPSVYLITLLLLARQPEARWVRLVDVEEWVAEQHPHWETQSDEARYGWALPAVAGLLFQLRLVQCATAAHDELLVRLSPFGRWLMSSERVPPAAPDFPQALIVQANFEVLAFRQGLSPGLIATLTKFARWKTLGTACQLELDAEHIYRGLESGLTFESVRSLLQRHGMRPLPDNVLDALRTWANKRERVVVYEDAALIEFSSAADLEAAVARGLVETRITDRIGLVRDENAVEYRHFRLTGTRDYGARPERCVAVSADGVTLTVEAGRADLLLDTELARVAEPANVNGDPTNRVYRLTRGSLRRALDNGWSLAQLDDWLLQRAGQVLSAAARLLALPNQGAEFHLERCLVVSTATPELADGLLQWAGTRDLIRERLGPTALLIAEEDVPRMKEQMAALQQRLEITSDAAALPSSE